MCPEEVWQRNCQCVSERMRGKKQWVICKCMLYVLSMFCYVCDCKSDMQCLNTLLGCFYMVSNLLVSLCDQGLVSREEVKSQRSKYYLNTHCKFAAYSQQLICQWLPRILVNGLLSVGSSLDACHGLSNTLTVHTLGYWVRYTCVIVCLWMYVCEWEGGGKVKFSLVTFGCQEKVSMFLQTCSEQE